MLEDSFQGSPPSERLPESLTWLSARLTFPQHSALSSTFYSKTIYFCISPSLLDCTFVGKHCLIFYFNHQHLVLSLENYRLLSIFVKLSWWEEYSSGRLQQAARTALVNRANATVANVNLYWPRCERVTVLPYQTGSPLTAKRVLQPSGIVWWSPPCAWVGVLLSLCFILRVDDLIKSHFPKL